MTRLKIGIQVFLPIFFATIIVVFPVVIKWFTPTRIKGVDSVAESMVNVASIDLGLFAAIIGVIVAFWDRTVDRLCKNEGVRGNTISIFCPRGYGTDFKFCTADGNIGGSN